MKRFAHGGVCTLLLYLAACSGSGPGVPIDPAERFELVLTTPANGGTAFLNDAIMFDFTVPVDFESASLDTVSFQAVDALGTALGEPVSGRFLPGRTTGDAEVGRRLVFAPSLPTDNDFQNGGLRPGRTYIVQLVGGDKRNGTVLRSRFGRPLRQAVSFSFSTVDGTSPAQLFRNPLSGGPRRDATDGLMVAGASQSEDAGLNLFGLPSVEIRLRFDQALNPHDTNVPVRFDTNPLLRRQEDRGRIYLEYDDPEFGDDTWIPADFEFERNDATGATVVLRPVGVLPNAAEIRVVVEAEVEDISGESNVGNRAHNRVFGTFRTESAYAQQWNGVVEQFTSRDAIDFGAVFPEPLAEVGRGFVKAGFEFDGRQTTEDYAPTSVETVLSTSFTQIVPVSGLPKNVSGGVFRFRNVTIPNGAIVKGQGPNPMVWLCTGDFRVDGLLTVEGGRGARVDTLASANFAKAGGIGGPGGGNGGDGSPSGIARDVRGANGNGPMQVPGIGGRGGAMSCIAGCMTGDGGGSGGGGGTLATQGDPWYRAPALPGSAFRQREGGGGDGCSGTAGARTAGLAGGDAAPLVFVDARADNDFFGTTVDFNRGIRINGEIAAPVGGGGGGGGGDQSFNMSCGPNPNFANDNSGGGGGGGGGVLIVKALGVIEVSSTGRISADGGHGGGGEQAGACNQGGGGGAGAGGMVILMSSKSIVLHAHGSATRWNYAQNDYDFCVSADGGVCLTGTFAGNGGAALVAAKYPASGVPVMPGNQYDRNPLGGFGGMGVVQLMAPIGLDNADQTNTRLDDNIIVYRDGVLQGGEAKERILAWRGVPDDQGVRRDDFGGLVDIGIDEGDIRPAPQLLPAPFGARSRLRSKWIDTGASVRRVLAAPDGLPRGIVTTGGQAAGPAFEFAGIDTAAADPGFARYEAIGGEARLSAPLVIGATSIESIDAEASHAGSPAYAVTIAAPVLGTELHRYRQYQAELIGVAGAALGSFRIVGHDARTLWLAPEALLPSAVVEQVQVRASFFRIETRGSTGLGPLATGTEIPRANVRIGFAFHTDPASGLAGRYPTDPQQFVHAMDDPGFLEWMQNNGAPRYVQWDVTFDMAFAPGEFVSPGSPRPQLDWLRVPFRF